MSGFLTNPLFPSIHHFHAAADKRTDRARMTIFSPPLPSSPYSEARRHLFGVEEIPFCPPSWKQLENGCGMLGRRQTERARKSSSSRAPSGRAARPKLMPSKFSLILLYLGEGEGREREREAWKAPLRSCSPRSPLPLLSPQLGNRPTNGGSRKYFKTFLPSSLSALPAISKPPHPSFPASFTFLIFFRSCRQLFSRKREKNKKVCHDLSPPPPPWSPDARGRGGRRPRRQPWRRRREKLVRS